MSNTSGTVPVLEQNPLTFLGMRDPYQLYRELRGGAPVVWVEPLGVWAVFRDGLVRQVLNDQDRFTAAGGTGLPNYLKQKQWKELGALESDPPDHTRLRSILARVLSPGAVNALKGTLVAEAEALVDKLVQRGQFDGVADFAKAYPLKVFLDAVGVPEEDRENVLIFNDVIRKFRAAAGSEMTQEDLDAVQSFLQWEKDFCRRDNMQEGSFGSKIYAAVGTGEITEVEGNKLVRTFISAGTGTTLATISQALYYLTVNPEQWAVVRNEPGKSRAAFDETLRFDAPAQFAGRCAQEAFEWEGVRIGKHDKILAFMASANRDPDRWAEPDSYDIKREFVGHLGLGSGLHGCVGQMLARLQVDVLLSALAKKAEVLELAGEPVRTTTGLRGFQSLPIAMKQSGQKLSS